MILKSVYTSIIFCAGSKRDFIACLRGMVTLNHDYLETPITHHFLLFPNFFYLPSDSY